MDKLATGSWDPYIVDPARDGPSLIVLAVPDHFMKPGDDAAERQSVQAPSQSLAQTAIDPITATS